MIFQLAAPPCTRDGLYDLSKLAHVCRFWRVALINQPRVWSTIFITEKDRRSFIEMCLERSHPVALDVSVDASKSGRIQWGCTCDVGRRGMLLPNESNPCERHFQFEPLAETKHSNRIRALSIGFDGEWTPPLERARFALGGCRFFTSSFPQLLTLTWKNKGTRHADNLFSTPPFLPTLCSLTYAGAWSNLIAQVNNLTSFEFNGYRGYRGTNTETVRLFMHNNRSLESLSLDTITFEGDSKGPPVNLLHLKSLNVGFAAKELSTIFRVPALRRLSTLHISSADADIYKVSATGDRITLTTTSFLCHFAESWEDLTGYEKPVIRHIRLYDGPLGVNHRSCGNSTIILQMVDAQTLEVGLNYVMGWYRSFWDELKQLGTQLKTIRFEVSGEMEPCPDYGDMHDDWDGWVWDSIEDLVKYRSDQGRPFSAIERLVVSESERENRMQDYVWRCFYGSRRLGQYVRPV